MLPIEIFLTRTGCKLTHVNFLIQVESGDPMKKWSAAMEKSAGVIVYVIRPLLAV
jgi:hypothetical protein